MNERSDQTTPDGRPNYCLHDPHPDPVVEAKAREIFMAENARRGGWWELVETPESWWKVAIQELSDDQEKMDASCGR